VAALFGAIFASSGITGMIRAGRDGCSKAEPFFDLGAAQDWLDRTLADPYPAAASFARLRGRFAQGQRRDQLV
jgi:hypothetical protein